MSRSRMTAAIAAVSAGALAIGLSACSGGGDGASSGTASAEGGSGKMTMAISQSADSNIRKVFQELIDGFQSANEGVTIELLPATNNYEGDMKVKMAAQDLPDIFATHGWSVKRYGPFLENLSNESWAADVNPMLDASMKDEEGNLYAFPSEVDMYGLTYNSDVLAEAGVDPASIDSWDSFNAACDKVIAKGKACIYAGAKDAGWPGNIANLMAPGAYTEADLDSLLEGTFPQEPWKNLSQRVVDWREKGYFNKDYVSASPDDMARALAQADTAFTFTQPTVAAEALSYNPDAKIAYIPIPADVGDNYTIGGEGLNALGVAKNGDVANAKKFLEYLAQPENAAKLVDGTGNPSGLESVKTDLGPLQESFNKVQEAGVPLVSYFDRVYMPNGSWSTMCTAMDSLVTGQGDADASVKMVEAEYKALFGQE